MAIDEQRAAPAPAPARALALDALPDLIRQHADEAERLRRLPGALVEAFGRAGIWRLAVPSRLGGLECDLPQMLDVFEALSVADSSAGWCAMIAASSGLVTGFLETEVAAEVLSGGEALPVGGTLNPARAKAQRDGDAWRLTGHWGFASGIHHCRTLVGGAVLFENGERIVTERGPAWRLFVFPAGAATIQDTWDTSGLRGTGSHDFEVTDVVVDASCSIDMTDPRPKRDGALYAFPLRSSLHVSVASVALGTARRAIDELVALAGAKRPAGAPSTLAARATTQIAVAEAEADLRSGRALLRETVADAWDAATAGRRLGLRDAALLRLAAVRAAAASAAAVDLCYTTAGGTALYSSSPLQRCLRDVHAVTQHLSVASHNLEPIGRVLLGVSGSEDV